MHNVDASAPTPRKKPIGARFIVTCGVFVGMAPAPALGQDGPWTINALIERGLEHANFEAVRDGEAMAGEGDARRAGRWSNPQLSYQREQLAGSAADLDTLMVTQRIDVSGRRGLRAEAATLRTEGRLKRLEWERALYVIQVRERFYALLYLQTRAERMESWHQNLKQVHDVIEARVAAGDASELERRRIGSALSLVESRRDALAIEREQAWAQLDALVGGLSAGPWPRVQGELVPEPSPRPPSPDRPDLQALELELRSLALESDAASRGWVPGLQLGLGYLRQTGGVDGSDDADGFTLTLNLSLPLFSNGQAEAQSARGEAQALSARRARAARELERRAGSVEDTLSRHLELARAFRQTLERADETAQLAREAYEGDALPLGELLNVYEHQHDVQEQATALAWQARRAYLDALRLHGDRP